jgi:hypothetical protein
LLLLFLHAPILTCNAAVRRVGKKNGKIICGNLIAVQNLPAIATIASFAASSIPQRTAAF